MSTIAWDGKSLVADKMRFVGTAKSLETKLCFVAGNGIRPDSVCGVIGHTASGLAIINWLKKGSDPATFPKLHEAAETTVVQMFETPLEGAKFHVYVDYHTPYTHGEEPTAWGAGADFAIMAMHLGLDAKAAIEATSKFSPYTSFETDNAADILAANAKD